MAPGLNKDETKEVVRQALKDWLDEKYLEFGKFSFRFFASAAFIALIYFIVKYKGFGDPQ